VTTGLLELICTYLCKIAVHVIFHICSIWLCWRIVLCIINVNLLTLDYQLQVSMNIVIPCKLHARFMVPLSGMSDRNCYRVEAENNLIIWISVVYFCLQGSKICVCLVRNIYQSSGEYVWLSTSSYHWQFVDCWWNNVELFLTKPHMDVRSARHHTRSQTIVCRFCFMSVIYLGPVYKYSFTLCLFFWLTGTAFICHPTLVQLFTRTDFTRHAFWFSAQSVWNWLPKQSSSMTSV